MLTKIPIILLALATTLSAQTAASYVYQNQIAPYSNPSPAMLTALTTPKIGGKLQLQVPFSWIQRNRVGENSVLAMGLKNPFLNVPAFQGYLFTSVDVILPTPQSPLGTPGNTTMEFAIPNQNTLIGVTVYQQVLSVPTTTPVGRLSRGGIARIGT